MSTTSAPEWVERARIVHAPADVGRTTAQTFERCYGKPIPIMPLATHHLEIPRLRDSGPADIRTWVLYPGGRIIYHDFAGSMLMETPIDTIPTPTI